MKNIAACYKVLGLNEDSDIKELKRAYRLKAKKLHPDVNGGESKEFVAVREAYTTLLSHLQNKGNGSNKNSNDSNDSVNTTNDGMNSNWSSYGYRDYSDLYEMGFNHGFFHKDAYEDVIPPPFTPTSRGEDIYLDIDITPKEQSDYPLINNLSKKISYKRKMKCTSCKGLGYRTYVCLHCSGNGFTNEVSYSPAYGRASSSTKCVVCAGNGYIGSNSDKCLYCKGLGYIEFLFETDVPIDLMAVIERGQRTICFEGLGHEVLDSKGWGMNGNLIINLNLVKNTSGNGVNPKVYINFIQAIEGCEVLLELDEGNFKPSVKIPPGIKSGSKLRIEKGNTQYFIEVLITVPRLEDMNRKARKLFNQLKDNL